MHSSLLEIQENGHRLGARLNTSKHRTRAHTHDVMLFCRGSFSHTYILIPDVVFPFMTCVSPQAPPTASRAPLLVDLQAHAGDFSEEGVENHRRRACYWTKQQQQQDPINGLIDQAQFVSGTSARLSDRSNNTSHNAHKLADTNLLTFTRTHTHIH